MSTSALWEPGRDQIAATQMTGFQHFVEHRHHTTFSSYNELHQWSIEQPELFWQAVWDFLSLIHI